MKLFYALCEHRKIKKNSTRYNLTDFFAAVRLNRTPKNTFCCICCVIAHDVLVMPLLFSASVVPQLNNQPSCHVLYIVSECVVLAYCCVFVSRRDIVVTSGLEGFCPFTMTAFLGPVGCH